MPLNINIVQILLHMLNFVILAGALGFLTYRPVSRFLAARREEIARTVTENEEAARRNESLRAEYERKIAEAETEANEIRVRAETEAAKIAADTIEEANRQAARILSAAEREAEERKAHILDSAQTEIGELVIEATRKLLAGTASEERARQLYEAFLETTRNGKE